MKNRILAAWLAAVVLTACAAVCAVAPATARTLNSDTWSGKVGPAQAQLPVSIDDDLLVVGGHKIILDQRTDGFTVSITVTANEDVTGRFTVTAPDDTWFTVMPQTSDLTLDKGETQTVDFTITMIRESEEQNEGEVQSAPSKLTFNLSWTSGATTLSGTFEMLDEDARQFDFLESNGQLTGVIDDPPSWYSVKNPLFLSIDGPARLKFSRQNEITQHGFPAGTKYRFGGVEYILYDGGFIDLSAAGNLMIDFAKTDVHDLIRLSTDSSVCEFNEVDAIEGVVLDTPLISSTGGTNVNLPYHWGEMTPAFTARQLTADQNGSFTWTATNTIICREGANGNVYLDTSSAPAGTYLVSFSWSYNSNVLYSTEIPLFVRYSSGGQGGNAN